MREKRCLRYRKDTNTTSEVRAGRAHSRQDKCNLAVKVYITLKSQIAKAGVAT